MCVYYDGEGRVAGSQLSLPIAGDPYFSSIGTISVRCPCLPGDCSGRSWSSVALQRSLDEPALIALRFRAKQPLVFSTNETSAVPVCHLPPYRKDSKAFRLSICTATMERSRADLVEWIEFHRLVGVQHFFIYDTKPAPSVPRLASSTLGSILADYVSEGLVTVVPWPYSNCVRGSMASGDWVSTSVPCPQSL